jgi:hypothetical protein
MQTYTANEAKTRFGEFLDRVGVSSRNGKNRTLSRSPPVFSRHPPFTAFCLAFLDDDGTNGYDHLLVIERGIPACRLEQFPPFR